VTSRVVTLKPASVHGPNEVTIATDRDVGGIAPAGHQDATDARLVVAGIERVPAAAEIDFEPGAEVHRRIVGRHPMSPRYPVQ
jgi:hypothetical protein